MSKIADILNHPEQVVTKFLSELEEKNGSPSHDARYIAECVQKVRQKISDLDLDPDDTTAEELYHALLVRYEKNSQIFDMHFDVEDKDFDVKASKAAALAAEMVDAPEIWVLKNKAARQALRINIPKNVMKRLHYRSLTSMLKREDVYELYLGAQILESRTWHHNLERYISKLDQAEFEPRKLKAIHLKSERWSSQTDKLTVFDPSVGAIALRPSNLLENTSLLTMILLLSEQMSIDNHLKLGSRLAEMGSVVEWWSDMEHLVTDLQSEKISFNVMDTALNQLHKKDFSDRVLKTGRYNFWHELLSRYEHLPPTEALFDDNVRQNIPNLKFNAPIPAYEFAEEFNG